MSSTNGGNDDSSFTNYISYTDPRTQNPRIGHYDLSTQTIQPLTFISGTPIENLYQVIEASPSNIIPSPHSPPLPRSSTRIHAPLNGRDILCVGKNYAEHAQEFNRSGFDSSDKVDQPTHPVIFTKRFTSVIADGEEIYPHPEFTQTADYEGELGVIIGKAGFRIEEEKAWGHVWGFTIVNDVTARERQRDHKQFYIGKSADTFCPMGPIAVPVSKVDKVLRVQTHVNGELRQDATTDDLIFSIPYLIKTMSEGQTLSPGDVLATGTPAGVGIGRKPPIYLKPGDTVAISITGLGTLTNRIANPSIIPNPTVTQIQKASHLRQNNAVKAAGTNLLTALNNKPLYYKQSGNRTGSPIFFIHGLGSTHDFFNPLIQTLDLDNSHSLHLLDLEGHGLSPTFPLSKLTISSFAADLDAALDHANVTSGATLIAHSLGALIAVQLALTHPDKISTLILLSPPPSPLPATERAAIYAQAETVRTQGLAAVVDDIVSVATSSKTKSANPLAVATMRISLLGQDPEGYAKACGALAEAEELEFGRVRARTLIVVGSEDRVASLESCRRYLEMLGERGSLEVLESVGHWSVFEDLEGVAGAVGRFLSA